MTRLAGLVLAAGAGRRMGGPKALLRRSPDAATFVEEAVAKVVTAGCDPVVVVVGAVADQVRSVLPRGVAVVVNERWDEGMGASLQAGIGCLASRSDPVGAVLVTLVDLPDVPLAAYRRVVDSAPPDATEALLRAAYGGVPGHPVVLGRRHWPGVLDTAHGDRGARDYLTAHPPVLVECGDLATGRDVDTPAELAPDEPA